MYKYFKWFLITFIVLFQFLTTFVMDQAIARSLVGDHIISDCGKVFQLGVNLFLEKRHMYNLLSFAATILMVVIFCAESWRNINALKSGK